VTGKKEAGVHKRRTWMGAMAGLVLIAAACSGGGGATPTAALPTSSV
jgi:hypothetical protein